MAIPGALAGVLWMLVLTGTTINLESLMGAIMAVGVGVANGNLLITVANEMREAGHNANERAGGATNRNDPAGRLRLLDANAAVYHDIVPRLVKAAPDALILVVTDPPDPLADLARQLAGHDRVLSTGTYLGSLRFEFHLAKRPHVSPASLEAMVIRELMRKPIRGSFDWL